MEDQNRNCPCAKGKICLRHLESIASQSVYLDESSQIQEIKKKCEEHDKECQFYCKKENQLLCFKCLAKHGKCQIEEICYAFEDLKSICEQSIQQYEKQLNHQKENILKENVQAIRALQSQEAVFRNCVDEIRNEFLTTIEKQLQSEMKKMMQRKQQTQGINNIVVQDLNQRCNQLLNLKNEDIQEICEIQNQIQSINQLKNQCNGKQLEIVQNIDKQQIKQSIKQSVIEELLESKVFYFQNEKKNKQIKQKKKSGNKITTNLKEKESQTDQNDQQECTLLKQEINSLQQNLSVNSQKIEQQQAKIKELEEELRRAYETVQQNEKEKLDLKEQIELVQRQQDQKEQELNLALQRQNQTEQKINIEVVTENDFDNQIINILKNSNSEVSNSSSQQEEIFNTKDSNSDCQEKIQQQWTEENMENFESNDLELEKSQSYSQLNRKKASKFIYTLDDQTKSLHIYFLLNGKYKLVQIQQTIPQYSKSIQYEDSIFLVGGKIKEKSINSVWQININGTCKQLPSLITSRDRCGITFANQHLYVAGGVQNGNRIKSSENLFLGENAK